MTTEDFLTRSAFADRQGWSPSYVTKLGYQGRLVFGPDPKLIDVAATLANLNLTHDPGKEYLRRHHVSVRIKKHVTAYLDPGAPPVGEENPKVADPKYWCVKTRREGALGDLAELELGRRRGDLVDRQSVEALAFASARSLRDTLLGLPVQLAPILATMTDSKAIETKLREVLQQVFSDAEKMAADDLARVCNESR